MSDIDKILDYLACDGYGTPIGVLESVPAARAELADLRRRAQGVSIEEVVDALLHVQPFRDGHETGSTGLVRRADVEQVMRALFDRRGK